MLVGLGHARRHARRRAGPRRRARGAPAARARAVGRGGGRVRHRRHPVPVDAVRRHADGAGLDGARARQLLGVLRGARGDRLRAGRAEVGRRVDGLAHPAAGGDAQRGRQAPSARATTRSPTSPPRRKAALIRNAASYALIPSSPAIDVVVADAAANWPHVLGQPRRPRPVADRLAQEHGRRPERLSVGRWSTRSTTSSRTRSASSAPRAPMRPSRISRTGSRTTSPIRRSRRQLSGVGRFVRRQRGSRRGPAPPAAG